MLNLPDPEHGPVADLVLEGGGVLGVAHVGALQVLDEAGYRFARVAGSSVGAVVGALVAANMPVARITEVLSGLDFTSLTDRSLIDRVPIFGPLASIVLDNGVYEGDALHRLVADLLRDECGVETFADLRIAGTEHLPVEQRYRLVVTATDTTRGELVRLPWDYERLYGLDPDTILVADAVRASASIPFFFEPVHLQAAAGLESTLVDGGVLSNFPVDLLDRRDMNPPRWPTFGIKLLPNLPAQADQLIPGLGLLKHGPVGLAADLVTTLLVGRDQARLSLPWVAARTIRVNTGSVSPVNFSITPHEVAELLVAGQTAATSFLDGWDFEEYVRTFRL